MMQDNDELLSVWAETVVGSFHGFGTDVELCSEELRLKPREHEPYCFGLSNGVSLHSEYFDHRPSPASSPRWHTDPDPISATIAYLDRLPSDGHDAPGFMQLDASLFDSDSVLADGINGRNQLIRSTESTITAAPTEEPPREAVVESSASSVSNRHMILQTSPEYEEISESMRGSQMEEPRMDSLPIVLIFHPEYEVPDRINATSPSRLATKARPGANFTVAVQLVGMCPATGAYVPAAAPTDICLRAQIWGKRRVPKKLRQKRSMKDRPFVPLTLNPENGPLMVCASQDAMSNGEGYVDVVVRQGESVGTFKDLSLTCGSNAARSTKASPAARAWDWEYHMLISQVLPNDEHSTLQSVMSRHITTDSNRSLTREKRKEPEQDGLTSTGQPPMKKFCATEAPAAYTQEWLPQVTRC